VINGGIAGLLDNSVTNAGTINGNGNLSTIQAGPTNNTFVAAAGGVLNGNLNLGNGGDTLVVTLGRAGSGLYPGITGTVTGTGTETLLSLVTADATATLAQPNAVFSVFGYDLGGRDILCHLRWRTWQRGQCQCAERGCAPGLLTRTRDLRAIGDPAPCDQRR